MIGLGFGFWTALGLGLGLRGPDLGLGLDNKYQVSVSVSVQNCAINNGSVASDWLSTEEMAQATGDPDTQGDRLRRNTVLPRRH